MYLSVIVPTLVTGIILITIGGVLMVRRRKKEGKEQADLLY
ncbi:MAG: LPXTG cell wall anchor domain-containing protein [Candidatus Brocadiales bacterium]